MEDLDAGRGDEDVHGLVDQLVGHRVAVPVDDDVIIDVDGAIDLPLADHVGIGRQAAERLALHRFEQGAAAAVAGRRHRLIVERGQLLADGLVELGQREELPVPQRRQQPAAGLQHAAFHRGLVARLARPGRDHRRAIMLDQGGVAGVDHRVVIGGVGDPDLEVVRSNPGRHPAQEGEQPHMGRQPVVVALGPGRLGVDQPRARQAGDEELGLPRLTLVHDRDGVAGIIDFERLAGPMDLPHRQAATGGFLPLAEQSLELAELVAVRVGRLVLQPQQLARHVLVAPQLLIERRPVRRATAHHHRRRKQRRLQRLVGQVGRRLHGDLGDLRAVQIITHRRARHPGPRRDHADVAPHFGL